MGLIPDRRHAIGAKSKFASSSTVSSRWLDRIEPALGAITKKLPDLAALDAARAVGALDRVFDFSVRNAPDGEASYQCRTPRKSLRRRKYGENSRVPSGHIATEKSKTPIE